jgi:hypothetical protein
LVDAVIDGKDLCRRWAELSVNPGLTRGHGSLLLDLYYFGAAVNSEFWLRFILRRAMGVE